MPTSSVRAVVLHSPLVGPSTTTALAAALHRSGWSASAPDLRAGISAPRDFAGVAERASRGAHVVIGHSGAGAFLPGVAEAVGARVTVYVDALVPGEGAPSSERFLEMLDTLALTDGRLPPWHEWWPEEVLVRLVPDGVLRRRIIADIPRLPRSFYDEPVDAPPGWPTSPAAFLRLSSVYEDDRARIASAGWPTRRRDGMHLDLVVDPDGVAHDVTALTSEVIDMA